MNRHDLLDLEDRLFEQLSRVLSCTAHAVYFPRDGRPQEPVWLPEENRLLLPLKQNGEVLGVMMCRFFSDPSRIEALLPSLPAIASLCLDNLELYRAGRLDSHTSLATRAVLLERLTSETETIRSAFEHGTGAPGLSLLLVRFTDAPNLVRRTGYAFAEKLMAALAEAFRSAMPDQSLCARSGEYELAALLFDAGRPAAERAALTAVHRLREISLPDPCTGSPVGLAPCAGYALYPQDLDGGRFRDVMEPAADLIHKAGLAAAAAENLPVPAAERIMAFGHLLTEGGRILRVLPLSCAELSLGRGEGAGEGMRFSVWANSSAGAAGPAYKGEVVIMEVHDTSSTAEILCLGDAASPLTPGDALSLLPEESAPQISSADKTSSLAEGGLLRHGDFLARLAHASGGAKSFALALVRIPETPRTPGAPADETTLAASLRLCRDHFQAAGLNSVLGGRFASNSFIFFHREISQEALLALYRPLCTDLAALAGLAAGQTGESIPARTGAGLACWPFLHYRPGDMVECARKALEYALLLPEPHVGFFDSLAINISADKRHCRGDVFGAIEEYKLALLADPDNALAWNSMGVCMAGLGRTEEARRDFEEALRRTPNDAAPTYNLGTACQRLGDTEAARRCFDRCLTLAPNHLFAALRLGQLAEQAGNLDEAETCYQNAARANAKSSLPRRHLARLAMKAGKTASAREHLHQALLRDPRDAEALSMLARLYIDGGEDAELAESLARQSAALRPDRKNGWLVLADALKARGFDREARAALLRAEEL